MIHKVVVFRIGPTLENGQYLLTGYFSRLALAGVILSHTLCHIELPLYYIAVLFICLQNKLKQCEAKGRQAAAWGPPISQGNLLGHSYDNTRFWILPLPIHQNMKVAGTVGLPAC